MLEAWANWHKGMDEDLIPVVNPSYKKGWQDALLAVMGEMDKISSKKT
jgi:hypothetical protein